MPFNIEQFKSETKSDFIRTNRFLMTFASPRVMLGEGGSVEVNRKIEFFCESVNMPGFLLGSHDVRRWTYGPVEKRPFMPSFTQLQTTFTTDGDADTWKFFNHWTQKICPHDAEFGILTATGHYSGSTHGVYELQYKNAYATDLNIIVFGQNGDKKLHLICREAFPSQIVDIPLSWGDTSSIMKFQVIFDFLDWRLTSEIDDSQFRVDQLDGE